MDRENDERVIELCEIPADMKLSTLTMILESHRCTGVAGVSVETLKFSADDQSRALVTLCTAESMYSSHSHARFNAASCVCVYTVVFITLSRLFTAASCVFILLYSSHSHACLMLLHVCVFILLCSSHSRACLMLLRVCLYCCIHHTLVPVSCCFVCVCLYCCIHHTLVPV